MKTAIALGLVALLVLAVLYIRDWRRQRLLDSLRLPEQWRPRGR